MKAIVVHEGGGPEVLKLRRGPGPRSRRRAGARADRGGRDQPLRPEPETGARDGRRNAALHSRARRRGHARGHRRARSRQRRARDVRGADRGRRGQRAPDSRFARRGARGRSRRRLQDRLGLPRRCRPRGRARRLLVQAGSSGTGQAAIDIGRYLGAKIYATASPIEARPPSRARRRTAGLRRREASPSSDAAVVFDPVLGERFELSLARARPDRASRHLRRPRLADGLRQHVDDRRQATADHRQRRRGRDHGAARRDHPARRRREPRAARSWTASCPSTRRPKRTA